MTTTEKNPDVDPNEIPEEEEEEKRIFNEETWMTYFEPAQLRTLITKRWVKFSSFVGVYYIF